MTVSRRAAAMDFSGIRKVFDLGVGLERPVDLSIGQPDYDVPESLKDVAVAAVRAGRNRYAPTAGLPDLRAELRRHVASRYGWEPEDVLVTAGVSGGLALAMLAVLDPGDEVLLPDPYFVSYKQLALMAGARPVFYDVYPGWQPDVAAMERLVTERTRVLLVNSPSNPTGAVLPKAALEGLAEFARKHRLKVISDEIYDDFCYDGEAPPSLGALLPGAVVLNGFSKSQAMTGWRVGWAAGPGEVIAAMTKIQQFTYVTVPPPFQLAALESLRSGGPRAAGHLDEYRGKRDLLCSLLEKSFDLVRPAGAFYAFPRAPWGTAGEFVAAAVKRRVLAIPGGVFSERDTHFRVSFAAPDAVLREGTGILCELAAGRPGG
jgi:aspartate/methionine/tyrosine aminotransferase